MSINIHLPESGLARRAAVRTLVVLMALCGGVAADGQSAGAPLPVNGAGLPNLGDGTDMTPGSERRLGDRIARELYRDPDYVDDAVLMEYVQGVWQPLLVAARQRGDLPAEIDSIYAWEILLNRERTINAFALPGAYLGLNLGLVGVVNSRDELASVLAHELSHVTQRHISRMMTRQSQQAPLLLAATILGILAAGKSPEAAKSVIIGSQAYGAQSQLNFSRDMEREADRMGFGVSTQAGFAPQGFVTMFAKLEQASRLNDYGNFPYLRSHPLSTERMADMQNRIELPDVALPSIPSKRKNAQEIDHAMMSARARVLANPSVDALRAWTLEISATAMSRLTPAQQDAALYGACMAAMKSRDFAQAQSHWQRLSDGVRGDAAGARLARLLGVELRLAQDDGAGALLLLQGDGKGHPAASRAELFFATQAQLQLAAKGPSPSAGSGVAANGGLAATSQDLQTWVAEHPRDAQAWQLLSSTYAAQERTLSSIRALAEVYVAHFDYEAALRTFKSAQDWARKGGAGTDHFEASIVDTRAREVASTVREQALEK